MLVLDALGEIRLTDRMDLIGEILDLEPPGDAPDLSRGRCRGMALLPRRFGKATPVEPGMGQDRYMEKITGIVPSLEGSDLTIRHYQSLASGLAAVWYGRTRANRYGMRCSAVLDGQ